MNDRIIEVFDTTLRDGAQQQGVNFSIADKKQVLKLLQGFGVKLIEGGWPGAIPKDTEFFAENGGDLVAFGATRKPDISAAEDLQVQALIDSGAPEICIVAKSDIRHVTNALRTSGAENLAMVHDTVQEIRLAKRKAIVDVEHFFDGFDYDADYAVSVVVEAFNAGARCVVLCDTNGGHIPSQIADTVVELRSRLQAASVNISETANTSNSEAVKILGIHAHNDTGCAVANTLAAVEKGIAHIQGTMNTYGERTGNADLISIIANLQIKMGFDLAPIDLKKAFHTAHAIADVANVNINERSAYVGDIAFAHKAGLHASAIKVSPDLYQHIDPEIVGNSLKMIISEMAGRSSIELKAGELGFDISAKPELLTKLTDKIKQMESKGYAFDAADATFELLLRDELNEKPKFFTVESWRVISERQGPRGAAAVSEATVKLIAGDEREVCTGEGNGPVNALDAALRSALSNTYPIINSFELVDYRVRILDTAHGTDSITRVLITCSDGNCTWTTVGVSENVIEASWEALTDCYIYGLIKQEFAFRSHHIAS